MSSNWKWQTSGGWNISNFPENGNILIILVKLRVWVPVRHHVRFCCFAAITDPLGTVNWLAKMVGTSS